MHAPTEGQLLQDSIVVVQHHVLQKSDQLEQSGSGTLVTGISRYTQCKKLAMSYSQLIHWAYLNSTDGKSLGSKAN